MTWIMVQKYILNMKSRIKTLYTVPYLFMGTMYGIMGGSINLRLFNDHIIHKIFNYLENKMMKWPQIRFNYKYKSYVNNIKENHEVFDAYNKHYKKYKPRN